MEVRTECKGEGTGETSRMCLGTAALTGNRPEPPGKLEAVERDSGLPTCSDSPRAGKVVTVILSIACLRFEKRLLHRPSNLSCSDAGQEVSAVYL